MEVNEPRQVRAAKNQSVFRAVNAQLIGLNQVFETIVDTSVFVCECSHMECALQIEMTLEDYSRIREDPRRFFVAPSEEHVLPDVEWVVERRDTYFVVEKIGVAAQVAAAAA
jgi:hypothetical protein